jgi:mono/diheme cytochrome c family protein
MICRRMRPLVLLLSLAGALLLSACGEDKIKVPADAGATHTGAVLFKERCAGCHTLGAAGTHGSAANIRTRERNDGPNFNVRCETNERVLYALRNGGFSGASMPQNIVVGSQADDVAKFVAKYAGTKAGRPCSGTAGG